MKLFKEPIKIIIFALLLYSCTTIPSEEVPMTNDTDQTTFTEQDIPTEIISVLTIEGYNVDYLVRIDSGYIVENDIFIHNSFFEKKDVVNDQKKSISSINKHYSTNNLVYSPRLIRIAVKQSPLIYHQALEIAIQRFNSLGLDITFLKKEWSNDPSDIKRDQMMGTSTDITVWAYNAPNEGYLAMASFPYQGKPGPNINLNRTWLESPTYFNVNIIATIIAHEIGHTIGFRHTDYMNRSFSCGGDPEDEGVSGVGANHIPFSPTIPVASWMQACNSGVNIPFTAADINALNILYNLN